MDLTYYGHATFQLKTQTHSILIDPFFNDNPHTDEKADSFSPDYIILTHAHGDHTADAQSIAQRSNATIISSFEIVNYYSAKGVNGHGMNPGGKHSFEFGTVKFTPAWHSSSFPDGTYGGMPMGVVIEVGSKRVYHAGDTALFSDMKLIGASGLDVALLPIGDNFTMGPDDAVEAVKLLNPKQVVPIHYNTFPPIKQDPQVFKKLVEQTTACQCIVLQAGEQLSL